MSTDSAVDETFPVATLPALDGTLVDFAAYRGKKLIIFIWASW